MSDLQFVIKKDNTLPILRRQLQNGSGTAINLTGATVTFYMRSKDGTQIINGASCAIEDAVNGWVTYTFTAAQTAVAGFHNAEFKVEYSPGNFESFPNEGYLQIKIDNDLDPN